MSAFMLKGERIAQLADYISALHNMGYDYFGYSMPETLHHELLDCRDNYGFMITAKVYDRLSDLNMRAVCGRYDREPFIIEDIPTYTQIYHAREKGTDDRVKGWYEEIQPWHYELLKLTQCFVYQCEEDATIDDPLYLALRELEKLQMSHIISNAPEYKLAQWG